MKKKEVTVGLIGGIGNQLFQFYAGLYLAKRNEAELVLDFSRIGRAGTNHSGSIKDFDLGCNFSVQVSRSSKLDELLWRVHQKISREFPKFRKFSMTRLGLYQSNVIGYDFQLDKLDTPIEIRGYFQSWRYLKDVEVDTSLSIDLVDPSSWFRAQSADIEAVQPVGIHVRRGDYESLTDKFGLLDAEYYSRSLARIGPDAVSKSIYVFSDDVEKAEAMLSKLRFDFHFVQPPKKSSPAESLLLMSKCSSLVIANSSFSWWAGMLGSNDRTVIAPSKWFRGIEDPEELIPSSWIKERSSWESI